MQRLGEKTIGQVGVVQAVSGAQQSVAKVCEVRGGERNESLSLSAPSFYASAT